MIAARSRRALPLAALLASGLFVTSAVLVPSANAQTSWIDATGSWFNAGNWSAGVPTAATPLTTVGNGGTAQIAGAAANAGTSLVINGGSTVDLQAGGSLTASGITIGTNGTLLLSGSTAVTGPTALSGATLRSSASGTLTSNVTFDAPTSTVAAAAGQALTLGGPVIAVNPNAAIRIGSATDTGTVIWAPTSIASITGPGTQTYEVVGGTWKNGNGLGFAPFTQNGLSTTIDAGATLDLNDFTSTVHGLLGAGRVATGVNVATRLGLTGSGDFTGTIAGAGRVEVFNGATVLHGTNTYSGGTTIDPGATLNLFGGGSIVGSVANNGSLVLFTGGTLNLQGALSGTGTTEMVGGTLRAATTSNVTGNVTFDAVPSTVAAAAGQTLTLGGAITVNGNAAIRIGSAADTGTVVWTPTLQTVNGAGTQTYEVVGGTWKNGSAAGFNVLTQSGLSTTVDAGATLDLNDFTTGVHTLLGAGRVTTGASAATTLGLTGSGNFSGTIVGAGQVEAFTGTTLLTGTNTYTGGTTIDAAATLELASGGSIIGSVANNGSLVLLTGGTLNLQGTLGGAGTTTLTGGTLRAAATSTVTGAVTFDTATSTVAAAAGQSLTLSGIINANANAAIRVGSATDTGTVIWTPSGGIIFSNGTQTYEVMGGTWKNGNGVLGGFTENGLSTTIDAGATLDLNDFTTRVHTLLGAGLVTTGVNAATELALTGSGNFAGTIAGAGRVLVVSGTTLLTGSNTYTGGTTINPGATLQLGNGGASGSIVGNVADNGMFVVNRSDTYTFGGVISGSGAFVQAGSGTTILTGINTYTGATTVNAGTLEVDCSIASSSSVTVNSGGTLSGTGIVDPATTTIASGGTLAPGNAANPTGTLTITGNLAFQAGALYLVQLSPSAASNTNVAGTATLTGANVQAALMPGSFTNRSYDILHAAGGLGGTTFSGVSSTNPNFSGSLSYTSTDVFLNLIGTLGAGAGLNQNQQSVANAINNVFNGGGTLPANFANIFGLTGGSLANALTRLDGEAATGAERAVFQLTNQFLNLMLDPFVNGRGNTALGGAAIGFAPEQERELPPDIALAYASILTKAPPRQNFDQRWTAWGSAYGGSNTANGNAAVGSNTVTASTFGFAGGMDYHFTPDTIAGFALAGAGTNWGLANALGTGRSDALQAGAYGMSWFGRAYVAGALAFSNHWFSTSRAVLGGQLTANFVGQSYGGRLESGYRTTPLPALGVTPYAALQAQAFHTPAYSETDVTGGGFGLTYAAMNATDVRTELGARFDGPTVIYGKPLILFGRLAWAHDFVSNPAIGAVFQSLPGGSFTVNGAPIPQNAALTSAGAQLFLTPQWTLLAKFDGEFASGSQTYAGSGTLRYTW